MVDRQNNVVQKLRRASESFDELSGEIRAIKQEFIESQARRNTILNDIEHEAEISAYQQSLVSRREAYGIRGGYGSSDYEPGPVHSRRGLYEDNFQPIKKRSAEIDDEDSVFNNNLGLATIDDDDTRSVYSNYTPDRRIISSYGRSKSLYDDNLDQDDDDFSFKHKLVRNRYDIDDDFSSSKKPIKSRYDVDKPDGGMYGDENSDIDTTGAGSSRYYAGSYTPNIYSSTRLSAGYASGASRYGQFNRSKTLNDTDMDSYSSIDYVSKSSLSGFSSRFLSKVRQNKAAGDSPSSAATKRDKPFKSRFLRSSFDTSDFPTPSTVFTTGRYSSTSGSKPFIGVDDDSKSDVSGSTADTAVKILAKHDE